MIVQAVDLQEKTTAEKSGKQSRRKSGRGFGVDADGFSTMLSTEWVDSATASGQMGQNQCNSGLRFGHNPPRRSSPAAPTL
jgi:hypothetical protein